MKRVFIRVERDDFRRDLWMITVQTEGFPKSVGFLDDKLEGLGGTKKEMFELAEKLRVVEQETNPNLKVLVVK